MINERIYKPAFAGASASGSSQRPASENRPQQSSRPNQQRKRPPQKKKKRGQVFEIDLKLLLIAAGVLLALILLVVMIVVAANSSGKDIMMKNNTYVSYLKDGKYYISVNGHTLDEGFDNEIELTPSLDGSFAYVVESTEDGNVVYILEKKELTEAVHSPVDEIIALAELEPGVVYKDGNNVNFFSKDNDDNITRNDTSATNFIISHDASAIAYTVVDKDDASLTKLFVYTDGTRQSYATNMLPAEISKGGKYLYAYGATETSGNNLYLINTSDEKKDPVEIDEFFYELNASNIKGDEIAYTIKTEKGYQSKIFNAKKEKNYTIGGGVCKPVMVSGTVKLSSLRDTVFENTFFPEGADRSYSATYFVDGRYVSEKLSQYNGKLNSNGDMFYYIDIDNTLYSVEIGKKNVEHVERASQVKDFVVTEKDNLYYLDEDKYLWFSKESGGNKQIETEVNAISFNVYSNTLYFDILDDDKIYSSEEGSGDEVVEFGKTEISELPRFTNNGQKRNYAVIQNSESGLFDIYYTSTGRTFKLIDDSCDSFDK